MTNIEQLQKENDELKAYIELLKIAVKAKKSVDEATIEYVNRAKAQVEEETIERCCRLMGRNPEDAEGWFLTLPRKYKEQSDEGGE